MKIRWSHVLGFLCGVFTAVVGSVLLKERTSPVEATAEEVAGIISEKLQHHLSSSHIPEE